MKKVFSVVLAFFISVLSFFGINVKQPDKDISLLFIGNSYAEDSGSQHLYSILGELGYEDIDIGILKMGYCGLDTHRENIDNNKPVYTYFCISSKNNGETVITQNVSIQSAIESYKWEYVSLQQNSANSGLPETYTNAAYIYDYVLKQLPDTQLLWNMTWAYGIYTGSEDFANYNNNQIEMYNAIVNTTKTVIVPMGNVKIMPTGTAIQNARTGLPWGMITRDEHHLGFALGRYIAALTVAGIITGKNVSGIQYAPEELTDEQHSRAIISAVSAIKHPYEITDIIQQEEEEEEEENKSVFDKISETIKGWFSK